MVVFKMLRGELFGEGELQVRAEAHSLRKVKQKPLGGSE
jgi:hypothetical protein